MSLRPVAAVLLALHGCGRTADVLPPEAMAPVDDFALLDHTGRLHRLSRLSDRQAVVIYTVAVGCPIVRQQLPRLRALRDAYADRDVAFLLLDASPQDDRAAVAADAEAFGVDLPVLVDETQLVAEALGVTRTAEAIVIDPRRMRITWRGPLDDRDDYGAQKPEAAHAWLAEALDGLLAGAPPRLDSPPPKGCLVSLPHAAGRRPTPTYAADVAPILLAKCAGCHHEGAIAPWAMTSYDVLVGWAPMVREVVRTRRMPPWDADPAVGSFAGDLSLTPEEARALVHWAEEGTPRGEGDDPLLGRAWPDAAAWPFGEPDLVIDLPEQRIPATGRLPYRHVSVPIPPEAARWVRAIDLRPSNRAVMHHGTMLVLTAEEAEQERDERGRIWQDHAVAFHMPGRDPTPFPDGTGRELRAGGALRFTLHYTTTGRPEVDHPQLGLWFADGPRPEFRIQAVSPEGLRIPAGARDHEVTASWTFPADAVLYQVAPHMHLRGKAFRADAELPDGTVRPLLSVPSYDFDWQRWYELATPLALPAGTVVRVVGTFDNSAANPDNPDPSRPVRWGLQTDAEMLVGYLGWRRADEGGPVAAQP